MVDNQFCVERWHQKNHLYHQHGRAECEGWMVTRAQIVSTIIHNQWSAIPWRWEDLGDTITIHEQRQFQTFSQLWIFFQSALSTLNSFSGVNSCGNFFGCSTIATIWSILCCYYTTITLLLSTSLETVSEVSGNIKLHDLQAGRDYYFNSISPHDNVELPGATL